MTERLPKGKKSGHRSSDGGSGKDELRRSSSKSGRDKGGGDKGGGGGVEKGSRSKA